jgi:hypothetical protein
VVSGRRSAVLAVLVLFTAACSDAGTLVVVTVQATRPITGITQIQTAATVGTTTRNFNLAAAAMSTPVDFGIRLPADLGGTISVHVALLGPNGKIGEGDGSATILRGSRTDVNISIGAPLPDMATPPDLALADMLVDLGDDMTTTDMAPGDMRTIQCAQETPPGPADLWTVFGSSATDIYAGGENGTILHSTGNGTWLVQHGTDTHLTSRSGCFFQLCPNDVRGIWASGPSQIIAVGEKTFGIMGSMGTGVWTPQTAPSTVNYWLAVWGTDSTHIWASGTNAALASSSGNGSWGLYSFAASSTNEYFASVWAATPQDLYLGSSLNNPGDVFHSTGGNPTFQTNLTQPITTVWGASSADVYLVIPLIGVHHSIGNGNWFVQSGATAAANGGTFTAIAGSSSSNVFAVGTKNSAGMIVRFDGSAWSPVFTISSTDMGLTDLEAVWVAPNAEVFAVGYNGAIVHCK